MVVLSDRTVVCGCTDPDKRRPLGNLSNQSVPEVWNGPKLTDLRETVAQGALPRFCDGCFLGIAPTQSGCRGAVANRSAGPQILQVEPCIRCNLRCPTPHCELNNTGKTRDEALLDYGDFCRIFDEVGPNLELLRLYNYGESFLNPRATDMIAYARKKRPEIYIDSHTNGMVFTTEKRRHQLVECGLDYIIFSIDGAYQETYEMYRRGGNLSMVLENLAEIVRLRDEQENPRLRVCWRYILFNWNDSDEEMGRALQLAREMGVDQFTWHINSADDAFSSERFRPGTPDFERIRDGAWGFAGGWANALSEKIDSRWPSKLLAEIAVDTDRIEAAPGERINLKATIRNIGNTRWLTGDTDARGTVRAGYHLVKANGTDQALLEEGRGQLAAQDVSPGHLTQAIFQLNAPREPGRYLLCLDLVAEQIDWFASFGSKVVRITLVIWEP